MNLKPKCKPSWQSFLSNNFIAIYIALALVLIINQVIFSYALKNREQAKADITPTLLSDMFYNQGEVKATKGTNDVTLASFWFINGVQNDTVACNFTLQGNPCVSMIDADGLASASTGTDDDGVTNLFKLSPYHTPVNSMYFQSSDQICVDSLTSPTCVWYDSDGDCNIGTGTPSRIIGSACGGFADIDLSSSSLPTLFLHSEAVKANGAYDYCGGPNSPGCPNNPNNTVLADSLNGCGFGTTVSLPLIIPVWDDVTGDNVFTPNIDTIYWDPLQCLTKGRCVNGACTGTTIGRNVILYLSDSPSCLHRIWADNLSMDGVYTDGVDFKLDPTNCLTNGATGFPLIDPEQQTETIWKITHTFDNLLKQGFDWNLEYPTQWQGELTPAWIPSGPGVETYKDVGAKGYYAGSDPVVIDIDGSGTYTGGDVDVYGIGGLVVGDPLIRMTTAVGPNGFPLIYANPGGALGFDNTDSVLEDLGNIQTGTTSNGYLDRQEDYFEGATIGFTGSLVPERDITNLRLYADLDGDGVCNASDIYINTFVYDGQHYVTNTSGYIPINAYFCIIGDIPAGAVNGSSGAMMFPQLSDSGTPNIYDPGDTGYFLLSGNSGPIGADLVLPYAITIYPLPKGAGAGSGGDTIPPGSPINIKISASENGTVVFTWQDPSDTDLSQIIIEETHKGAVADSAVAKGIQNLKLDGRIVSDTYEYDIRAKDTSGNLSSSQVFTVIIPSQGSIEVTAPTYSAAPLIPTLPQDISVGDVVKSDKSSELYFVGIDHKKHLFPNEIVYNSWYTDFTRVVTIPADELDLIVTGTDVVIREGTYLVKKSGDSKIYAVDNNGLLIWVSSDKILPQLYGSKWQNRLVELSANIFNKYTIGPALVSITQLNGSLISYVNSSKIYYIDEGKKREVPKDIYIKNGYQDKFISKNISSDVNIPTGAPMTVKNIPTYFQQ